MPQRIAAKAPPVKASPVSVIVKYAPRFGLDPAAVLAYALEESSLRWNALGDHGTSFGPFQMHRGGALGSHSGSWAESPAGLIAGMRMMADGGAKGLRGEAAVRAIYSGFGKGTPLAVPKGIAQYGNAQKLAQGLSGAPSGPSGLSGMVPAVAGPGSPASPQAVPPYQAPDLGPLSAPLGGGTPLENMPGIPRIDQVHFESVVEHTNGKPFAPTPKQMQQVVGGTVHGAWKYPQMITGTSASFSNLVFAGHTDHVHVDTTLLAKMNQLGKLLGVKIDVISGYRAPGYSSRVGGYSNDPHARGVAVDAYISGRPVGDYPGAVALLRKLGLESGAQPGFYHGRSDPEHVQIPGSGVNKSIHARHTLK